MDKKYQVVWAKVAENDLTNIIKYIVEDSTSNALEILKKIKEKASNLYYSPKRGRVIPELRDFGILQYRELIMPPWRIVYRIAEEKVFVLSILDSRQNIEDILLKRFLNL
jgi:plasmid stabilization system protein ParE